MQPNYGPNYPAAPTMGYGEQQPGTYALPPQGPQGQQQYGQPPYQQPQQPYQAQYAQPYPQPGMQGYSAQPPMGYGQPQMQGGGGTVVIIEQGGIPGGFGNMPTACVCPQCHANIQTAVTFCMDSCQDVTHSCPSCSFIIRRKPAFTD